MDHNWLVVWNMTFIFPYIGNVVIPIDVHIFQKVSNHQPDIDRWCSYENLSLGIFQPRRVTQFEEMSAACRAVLTKCSTSAATKCLWNVWTFSTHALWLFKKIHFPDQVPQTAMQLVLPGVPSKLSVISADDWAEHAFKFDYQEVIVLLQLHILLVRTPEPSWTLPLEDYISAFFQIHVAESHGQCQNGRYNSWRGTHASTHSAHAESSTTLSLLSLSKRFHFLK